MGRADDDGAAPTVPLPGGLGDTAPASRSSRPAIDGLVPGAVIGRYRLVERLGAGAMGVVWSAHDPQLDRLVAIKLLHPRLASTAEAASRLLREARAMAKLSHRNVITVHDAGEVEGQLFIAMELVEGTTLGAMLRTRTADEVLDWRRWLALLVEAGRGLEAAHARGVLHRDFKPDNVLVDRSGRACVGDFGVALLGDSAPARATSQAPVELTSSSDLTTTGALLGTPLYMSPQQLRSEAIDARADQFSFCVAAWEALYGARPFQVTGSLVEVMGQLLEQIESGALAPAPSTARIPSEVRDILVRGLSPDPAARWPDLAALLAALEEATRQRRRPWLRRRWAFVVGAAVLAGGLALALLLRPKITPPEPTLLFNVSLRTSHAMSPDGRRIALGSDVLEVREFDGNRTWTRGLNGQDVGHVELDDHSVRFAYSGTHTLMRWDYATTDALVTESEDLGGRWDGTTAFGPLVYRTGTRELAVIEGGKPKITWKTPRYVEVDAISPDGKRLAYLESTRFTGSIVVKDFATGGELRSPLLAEPTAVTWLDDRTLLYATGTSFEPTLFRVALEPTGFGAPKTLFGRPRGWFGHLWGRGSMLLLTEMRPTVRAKAYERVGDASAARDLDAAKVGAALGWVSPSEYLTWNAVEETVDRRSSERGAERTSIVLAGEPAGATVAEGTLIVALRATGGRRLHGIEITSGRVLWTGPDLHTLVVRCAGDQRPPCFAIRSDPPRERVVRFDPLTGIAGPIVFERTDGATQSIDDIAVSDDGTRLLVAGGVPEVLEISPSGDLLRTLASPLIMNRGVAYDPRGGILIAGTVGRSRYQVGELRESFRMLGESDSELLSLVRPSPDGAHVLVLARLFAPMISRLELPSP